MIVEVVRRRQKGRKSHIDEANQRAMEMPLVQRGATQMVFNPFPRRHLESSPSEDGDRGSFPHDPETVGHREP